MWYYLKMIQRGIFITLEGVEGAGKTTQAHRLAEGLGGDVLVTREPGGTPLSEQIRELFFTHHDMPAITELLLIAAARAQHVTERIQPALNAGQIVICDRFIDATIAYQGYRKGIDGKLIAQVNYIATAGLTPDITFLLDLPPDIGCQRKRESAEPLTRIELEALALHEKVREGYLAIAAAEPQRVKRIDAQLDVDTIHHLLLTETEKVIKLLQTD